MSNLNPVWSIGFQVEEAIRANGIATGKDVKKYAIQVLKEAGLADADKRLRQFPHQFSGGMRQRVLIGIGVVLPAEAAHRRRADVGAGRDGAARDPRPPREHDRATSAPQCCSSRTTSAWPPSAPSSSWSCTTARSSSPGPSREILENPQHPYTQRLVAAAPSLASRRIQSSSKSLIDLDYAAPAAAAEVDLVHAAEDRAVKQAASGVHDNAIVVKSLTKVFKIRGAKGDAREFKAVDDVSFAIERGTTMALVGESGSGKSTVAKLLLRLEDVTSGQITIDGVDTAPLKGRKLLALRRKMQPVFQDPYGSLDPLRNIGNTIAEPLIVHKVGDTRLEASAGQRTARPGGASAEPGNTVPRRAVRWAASACGGGQGARAQARDRHPRRGGLGARRAGAGADPRSCSPSCSPSWA